MIKRLKVCDSFDLLTFINYSCMNYVLFDFIQQRKVFDN